MIRIPYLLLFLVLIACGPAAAPPPAPVKLEGTSHDLQRLAGNWHGEFQAEQRDRRGAISFALAVDSDTAYGSVTLQSPTSELQCVDAFHRTAASQVVAPIVLRVGAVATSEGSVGGWMRPYIDPEAGCWVDTWFQGRLVRDTLAGTYFSRRTETEPIRRGTWWATRY